MTTSFTNRTDDRLGQAHCDGVFKRMRISACFTLLQSRINNQLLSFADVDGKYTLS